MNQSEIQVYFLCYNYYTLFKAVFIQRQFYCKSNCIFIFRETSMPVPKKLKDEYTTYVISRKLITNKYFRKFANLFIWILMISETKRIISSTIDIKKNHILVVFKDHELYEISLIDYFKELTNKRGKVVLVEEGLALYLRKRKNQKVSLYYRLLCYCFRLPRYFLDVNPQGYNLLIDSVICSNSTKFQELKGRNKLKVCECKMLTNENELDNFLIKILDIEVDSLLLFKKKSIVYITQPLEEFKGVEKAELEIIQFLLQKTNNTIIVKKHPRDKRNRVFRNERVFVLHENLSKAPFELLCKSLGSPIILTFYSSVFFNILAELNDVKVILLFKQLNDRFINAFMQDLLSSNNKRVFILNEGYSDDDLNKLVEFITK